MTNKKRTPDKFDESFVRAALNEHARHSIPTTDLTLAVRRRMLARESRPVLRRLWPVAVMACAAIVLVALWVTSIKPKQAATPIATVAVAVPTVVMTPLASPTPAIRPVLGKEVMRIGRGAAWGAQYSPDGKRIAVQSTSGIYLYDSDTLSETGLIPAVAWDNNTQWSNDGTRIATFEFGSGKIDIWDAATAQRTLVITTGAQSYSSFSFNGNLIAIGGGYSQAAVRDATTGAIAYQSVISNGAFGIPAIIDVVLSSNGTRLAVRNADGRVRMFALADKVATLSFEFDLPQHLKNGGPGVFALSPDGKTLAAPSEGGIKIYAATTGQTVRELAVTDWASLQRVVYSQDGRWLIGAVATPDRMLKTSAWEASTGKPVTLEDGFWPITGREFSPDGNWKLESRGNQVNIRRSFGATSFPGAPRTITGYHEGILSMALRASPAGNELVVATSQGLEAFDAGSGAARQSPIQHVLDGPLINSMLSPDGRYLATTTFPSSDILTNLYDYLNGISLGRVDACTNRFVVVSNTIQTRPTTFVTNTLLACATDKAVQVIDVATQKPRTSIPVTNLLALAASHDGQRLAISARGLPIMIFDSETGWLAATMTNSKGDDATTMQWTPDDAQLIEVSSSGAVHVWDAKTGKVIRCCIGESTLNNVGAVSALSPDERLLAVAYYPIGDPNTNPDFIIRLWDPATGQSRGSLKGHAAFVSALAFSRDGTRLFSGSYDGTVRAWQLFDAPVVGSH